MTDIECPAWAKPYVVTPVNVVLNECVIVLVPTGKHRLIAEVYKTIDSAIDAVADDIADGNPDTVAIVVSNTGKTWLLDLELAARETIADWEENARAERQEYL